MIRIRALIAEDEPAARSLLRSMLDAHPAVEVVAEVANGRAAVSAIAELRPEVVFLDVQMPELDGFGVLESVGAEHMPILIFVTAYDQYALRAFDVHAVDYLLKPFDAERVDRAVQRALLKLEHGNVAGLKRHLQELLERLRNADRSAIHRIPVKAQGRVRFVELTDIDWIEAADHDLRIHAGQDTHIVRDSLTNLEAQLDPSHFLRIHRRIIINVRRVLEIQRWFEGDYVVILGDGTRLTTGRTYRNSIRRLVERRGPG